MTEDDIHDGKDIDFRDLVIHDIKVFNKPSSIWTSLAAFLALSAGLSISSIELFAFVDSER